MSNNRACLLRGKDLAGSALALSAGGVLYFVTQALSKSINYVCAILELVEKMTILLQSSVARENTFLYDKAVDSFR